MIVVNAIYRHRSGEGRSRKELKKAKAEVPWQLLITRASNAPSALTFDIYQMQKRELVTQNQKDTNHKIELRRERDVENKMNSNMDSNAEHCTIKQ